VVPDWPLLEGLDDAARQEVLRLARPQQYGRGEVVCTAGEPADSVHLVERGRLLVQIALDSGTVATLNVLGPGDCFGELALLRTDHRRTATVTALEPARTRILAASAFRRLCVDHPQVERSLSELLASRIEELSQDLSDAMYLPLEVRVRKRLAELVRLFAGPGAVVGIPITQSQLAELVGGTRPTVNQILQGYEAEGLVALRRGRIEVPDRNSFQA
jgi:CRP/FNR family cyclic AMP-dependent transcriptional regulator